MGVRDRPSANVDLSIDHGWSPRDTVLEIRQIEGCFCTFLRALIIH